MQIPASLRNSDTVMIIAPAGPPMQSHIITAKQKLEKLGLSVILGKSVQATHGYLAGDDSIRLHDLHEAFCNPNVKAIFCARGGYGSGRLLDYIDYDLIQSNPKIFWGYSDITALHIAFGQHGNLVTFHGPMMEELGKELDSLSLSSFEQLFHPYSMIIRAEECISNVYPSITAPLTGGNLSVITSTLGTPYEIDTSGKILLLEDIGEEPYRIDRMLNQLRLAGKFSHCRGIFFTSCYKCTSSKPSLSLQHMLYDYIVPYNIPILIGAPIGHVKPNIGIPLHVPVTLHSQKKTMTIPTGIYVH
ncbi:LD-carboxypeptidase [Bacillus manliponensis]|uniref:S66 peptidase family protein n=1 Tax=Bacillus manliponensis TaxID=574376 RepID=UPI003511A309